MIPERVVPPLAVTAALFVLTLALTGIRPRAGAIGVGVHRDAAGPIAARTLQTVATVMLTGLTVSLLAGP